MFGEGKEECLKDNTGDDTKPILDLFHGLVLEGGHKHKCNQSHGQEIMEYLLCKSGLIQSIP